MKTQSLLSESKLYVIIVIMAICHKRKCMAVVAIFNINSVMLILIRRDLFGVLLDF